MAALIDWWMRPSHANTHAAPDYSDHSETGPWAAWPDRDSRANLVPDGEERRTKDSQACDCFYVHPTCFGVIHNVSGGWNSAAVPGQDRVADMILQHNLATQASAFNGSCRIFAPRYRQMALGGYFPGRSDEERSTAVETAYEDVKAAFLHFLDARGDSSRPFVIASHSQGTMHCGRLVLECVQGKALARNLVCAYLIGFLLPCEMFSATDGDIDNYAVRVATSSDDVQCVLGYDTVPTDAPVGTLGRSEDWRARFGQHFFRSDSGEIVKKRSVGMERLAGIPGDADTAFRGCILPRIGWRGQVTGLQRYMPKEGAPFKVSPRGDYLTITPSEDWWPGVFVPLAYKIRTFGSYHSLDISMFWFDLREDVRRRLASWQQRP